MHKRILAPALLAAAVAVTAIPAAAEDHILGAAEMAKYCQDTDGDGGIFCMAYIQGAQAALMRKGGLQCPAMTGGELMSEANIVIRNEGRTLIAEASKDSSPALFFAATVLYHAGCRIPKQ